MTVKVGSTASAEIGVKTAKDIEPMSADVTPRNFMASLCTLGVMNEKVEAPVIKNARP